MATNTKQDKKNFLEWLVFGLSLASVFLIFAYLLFQVAVNHPSPPDIQIAYKPQPTPHAPFRYHLTLENVGGTAAENVLIELVMKDGESVLERAQLEIPHLPHSSSREGWVNFSQNPAQADTVTARIISFKEP